MALLHGPWWLVGLCNLGLYFNTQVGEKVEWREKKRLCQTSVYISRSTKLKCHTEFSGMKKNVLSYIACNVWCESCTGLVILHKDYLIQITLCERNVYVNIFVSFGEKRQIHISEDVNDNVTPTWEMIPEAEWPTKCKPPRVFWRNCGEDFVQNRNSSNHFFISYYIIFKTYTRLEVMI